MDLYREATPRPRVRGFAGLLRPREGNPDRLDAWIATARAADLPHMHAFVRGPDQDRDSPAARPR
ncbi:hypothetical protein [Streptosporangium sp. NPDC000396]|uniref:hypothetical protein n=1 Tax=Streptosporangium sp. NPDC000396 TaxID=3366185 RepID=UPI0036C9E3DB